MIPPSVVCDFTREEFFSDPPRQASVERALVSSFSAEGNMSCLILKSRRCTTVGQTVDTLEG
jgi:hypothetical protein